MLSSPSYASVTREKQASLQQLLHKAGEETSALGVGEDVVSGSQLPSHSDVHVSCLTGHRIQVSRGMVLSVVRVTTGFIYRTIFTVYIMLEMEWMNPLAFLYIIGQCVIVHFLITYMPLDGYYNVVI